MPAVTLLARRQKSAADVSCEAPSLPPYALGRPQRLLTSALLHQSFSHLASNALLLLALGLAMERKHGSWRVAAVVLLAALGGNLLRWAQGTAGGW